MRKRGGERKGEEGSGRRMEMEDGKRVGKQGREWGKEMSQFIKGAHSISQYP